MCWIGAASSASAQLAEQGLARGAVVGEHPHLDQAVGTERGIELAAGPLASAPSAPIGDDGVQVMGVGALLLAFGGGEEEGGHRSVLSVRGRRGRWRQPQEQEGQQGVAARSPDRSLREAGAARGLSGARRLQAEGDRRAAAPPAAGPARRRSRRRARAPGASTCGESSGAAPLPARTRRCAPGHHPRARPPRVRADRRRRLHPGRLPRARGPGARWRRAWAGARSTSCSPTWRPTCRASPRPTPRGCPSWSSWRSSSPGRTWSAEGALVCKVFHGSGYSQLVKRFKDEFRIVKPIKPKASRAKSAETFLVGIGLKPRASGSDIHA